ncbi:hypothetical protein EBZ37_14630, partial [bacterium]|nr:hypothetical protein [bacterium]
HSKSGFSRLRLFYKFFCVLASSGIRLPDPLDPFLGARAGAFSAVISADQSILYSFFGALLATSIRCLAPWDQSSSKSQN